MACQVRSSQYRALVTGVQGIDFDVPIGRGQTMLFQGSDPVEDRRQLWPDLLMSRPVMGAKELYVNAARPSSRAYNRPYINGEGLHRLWISIVRAG